MKKGSGVALPVVGVQGDCRLGDRALEVFEGIAEICKHGRLILEVVPQLIKVGEEASKNISVLQVDEDTYRFLLKITGLVHHTTGILLCMVAGFFKILVALDGGANVEGELGADDMVNGISEGGEAVKEDDLVVLERGAGVVNRDDLQDAMVNGVTFSKGCIHFRVVGMNVIIYEGGNNEIAGRWIRNREPVVRDGERIIQYPSLTWMVLAHPLGGWMLLVSLWRLGHWVPGVIFRFGLLVIISPGRIVF